MCAKMAAHGAHDRFHATPSMARVSNVYRLDIAGVVSRRSNRATDDELCKWQNISLVGKYACRGSLLFYRITFISESVRFSNYGGILVDEPPISDSVK